MDDIIDDVKDDAVAPVGSPSEMLIILVADWRKLTADEMLSGPGWALS